MKDEFVLGFMSDDPPTIKSVMVRYANMGYNALSKQIAIELQEKFHITRRK